MITKIREHGKLKVLKTIKFNLGFLTSISRLPIRGSAMRTMPNGSVRKSYNLANRF
jgi:hypothetical protein